MSTRTADTSVSPPFAFTFELFGRFYVLSYFSSLARPVVVILQVILLVALPAWLRRFELGHGVYGPTILIVALALVAVYVVIPPVLCVLAWSRIRNRPTAKGLRTVGFDAQTLHAKGEMFDIHLDWQAVMKIDRSLGLIIFYTQKNGGILAPVSAFGDDAEAQAFYDRAIGCFTAAKAAAAKSALDG